MDQWTEGDLVCLLHRGSMTYLISTRSPLHGVRYTYHLTRVVFAFWSRQLARYSEGDLLPYPVRSAATGCIGRSDRQALPVKYGLHFQSYPIHDRLLLLARGFHPDQSKLKDAA